MSYCSLQRIIPLHVGYRVTNRTSGYQKNNLNALRSETSPDCNHSALQGLHTGHYID